MEPLKRYSKGGQTKKYKLGEKIFRYCNFECRLV